jgi:hypothetical protein
VALLEYCKLWNLADRFLMPQLQNDAISGLIDSVGFRFISYSNQSNEVLASTIAEVFGYVYANDTQDGPLGWVCMEVLLPQWTMGSRSQDTVSRLYEMVFGDGMALDMIKSMARVGINYADYHQPPAERFFVETEYEQKKVNAKTPAPRRRVFSDGARVTP